MANTLTRTQLGELRRKLEEERTRILRVLGSSAPTAQPEDREAEFEEAAQRATERTQQLEVESRGAHAPCRGRAGAREARFRNVRGEREDGRPESPTSASRPCPGPATAWTSEAGG